MKLAPSDMRNHLPRRTDRQRSTDVAPTVPGDESDRRIPARRRSACIAGLHTAGYKSRRKPTQCDDVTFGKRAIDRLPRSIELLCLSRRYVSRAEFIIEDVILVTSISSPPPR